MLHLLQLDSYCRVVYVCIWALLLLVVAVLWFWLAPRAVWLCLRLRARLCFCFCFYFVFVFARSLLSWPANIDNNERAAHTHTAARIKMAAPTEGLRPTGRLPGSALLRWRAARG